MWNIVSIWLDTFSLTMYSINSFEKVFIFKRAEVTSAKKYHCMKSVKIRSFFWSIFSRIWTEYGVIKYLTNLLVTTRVLINYIPLNSECLELRQGGLQSVFSHLPLQGKKCSLYAIGMILIQFLKYSYKNTLRM